MFLQTFFEPKLDLDRLRAMLDTCGPWARANAVHTLTPAQMKVLFEACEGEALTLDAMVPTGEPLVEVIHHGKNTLPMFSHFQKRFCRPDGEDSPDQLWGYNHNGGLVTAVTGPGYFVATLTEKGEVLIDYAKVPPRKPAGWPTIMGPTARAGSLVWAGMTDVLRRVTDHVTIGTAYMNGKPRGQYFALCREDPKV
ncbi:MAG: hypothetical protein IPF99_09770 [Deltaproteobacteria bacterium]|nr:hypothetical protein [Deltaproteobacteria bacterium]